MQYKSENKWTNKENRQTRLIDTHNSMVVTRGKGDGDSKRGQIYGAGGLFVFEWWAHNAT